MKATLLLMKLGKYRGIMGIQQSRNILTASLCIADRHFLGVEHTFANGCSPGDLIPDTPAEAYPNFGCNPEEMRDTCPEPGLDPIHNFMDYSFDVCMYEWTQGQINVMHANIEFYRLASTPDLLPVELTPNILSDSYTMAQGFARQFYVNVSSFAKVICQATADNGNIDLYMNWNGNLDSFDCTSETPFSQEICMIGPSTGQAYAWVYSTATTISFQVRCAIVSSAATTMELTDGVTVPLSMYPSSMINATLSSPDDFSKIICTTDGSGDVDLTVSFSTEFPYCTSATLGSSDETCVIGPQSGIAYIVIFAWTASEINLKCEVKGPIELLSGVTSGPYDVAFNEQLIFFVDVTNVADPSIVECETSGGDNGNVELFMSWNNIYDLSCFSTSPNSTESCALLPGVGKAYALVYGYAAASDFTITCTISQPYIAELINGEDAGPFDLLMGDNLYFFLNVTQRAAVSCVMDGVGDADLYTYWNDLSIQSCSSASFSSSESCFLMPGLGVLYIRVFGFTASMGITLACSAPTFAPTTITSGVSAGPFNVGSGESVIYLLTVNVISTVICVLGGGNNGNVRLNLFWNNSASIDCATSGVPSSLQCSLGNGVGEAYSWIYGYTAASGVSLFCTSTALVITELTDNVPSGPHDADAFQLYYFSLEVPFISYVTCATSADNGELDLYMNWDASTIYECYSGEYGPMETCTIGTGSGTAYAIIMAFSQVDNYMINCTISVVQGVVVELPAA